MPPPPAPTLTLTLGAPPGTELGSGDEPLDAAISPDERHIVFVATRGGTTIALAPCTCNRIARSRLRVLKERNFQRGPRLATQCCFLRHDICGRSTLADGKISDIADAPSPSGATSLPDGSILFAPQSTGVIRRLRDGQITDATTLRPVTALTSFPSRTGSGNDFVYTAVGENGRRTVRLVHDREERDLSVTSGHGQIVAGYLLVVRDDVLLAQRVEARRERSGTQQPAHHRRRRDARLDEIYSSPRRACCSLPHPRHERASWRGST